MKKHLRPLLCSALAATLLLLVSAAPASQEGLAAANQVSQASYQGFLNDSLFTHTGMSRGRTGAQHDPARDNIHDLLQSYGLEVTYETFSYSGGTW